MIAPLRAWQRRIILLLALLLPLLLAWVLSHRVAMPRMEILPAEVQGSFMAEPAR